MVRIPGSHRPATRRLRLPALLTVLTVLTVASLAAGCTGTTTTTATTMASATAPGGPPSSAATSAPATTSATGAVTSAPTTAVTATTKATTTTSTTAKPTTTKAPCSAAAVQADLVKQGKGFKEKGAKVEGTCSGEWFRGAWTCPECFGDTDFLARRSAGTWTVYTPFPTSKCAAQAAKDGVPAEFRTSFPSC